MTIGVLRGGPSSHYDLSLASGARVISSLRDKYPVRDIYIDREGTWHYEGLPTTPIKLVPHIDVFWNALHGEYGEDGIVQRDLDNLGISYTGPGAMAARLAWRKDVAKKLLREAGLSVPEGIVASYSDDPNEVARNAFRQIGGQYIVKPVAGAYSAGVFFVQSYSDLAQVLEISLDNFNNVLVEEAIHGKEVKCLVAKDFRGKKVYSFLPIEVDRGGSIGIYRPGDAGSRLLPSARLSGTEKEEIMNTALLAYQTLNLASLALVDMILAPRGVVVLEVDALPDFSEGSALDHSLRAVGATPTEFFSHIATSSLG